MNEKEIFIGGYYLHNGNWCYRDLKKPTVIKWTASDWYAVGECTMMLEDLSPVVITEEWADRFEKAAKGNNNIPIGTDIKLQSRHRLGIEVEIDYGWHSDGGTVLKHLKYVHQLQNLIHALTGEELSL
jgi:hypothetical protein